jgi:hypothetical protein
MILSTATMLIVDEIVQSLQSSHDLRHKNGSFVGGDLVHASKELGNCIIRAYIRAKSHNSDNLGRAILSIKDLRFPEEFFTFLLLEKFGRVPAVSLGGEPSDRLLSDGDTLNFA